MLRHPQYSLTQEWLVGKCHFPTVPLCSPTQCTPLQTARLLLDGHQWSRSRRTSPQFQDSQGYQAGCDTERELEVGPKVNALLRSRLPDGKEGALIRAGQRRGDDKFVIRFLPYITRTTAGCGA